MMQMQSFTSCLTLRAAEAGVAIQPEEALRLFEHARMMLEWNTRVNLTRIVEPGEIVDKHILDSIIPARDLPAHGAALDVGTGPGFPGIPLKILMPERRFVLLEKDRKKVSFLRVVLSRLQMQGIHAVQGHSDDFAGKRDLPGSPFSLITMRAVRLDSGILDFAATRLGPDGIFAWWAGPGQLEDELPPGDRDGRVTRCGEINYLVPGSPIRRRVFLWRASARVVEPHAPNTGSGSR